MKSPTIAPAACPPVGGRWTLDRRVQFLRCLADKGDVRRACARVGLSRQGAYKLRGRDPDFAQIWDAALEVAREARIERLLTALGGTARRVAESEGDSRSAFERRKSAENRGIADRLTHFRTPRFASGDL